MRGSLLVLVLAGGEGRRLGGGKPLRRLRGEALIARALRKAERWGDEVRVAVRSEDQLGGMAAPLLLDDAEIGGPLGGLAAGLRHASAQGREAVLTLPCDMPFLPDDLAARLEAAIGPKAAAIAASGGELHPVCGLWRTALAERIGEYVERGRRSLRGLAAEAGFAAAEWSAEPLDPFFNVNDEEGLQRAGRLLDG